MADIIFTGNTGKDDAVLRFTPSGRAVLNFSVADSKSKPDGNGGWEKLAEQWFSVTIWGDLAEFYSDKLPSGSRVKVYGEFYQRKYETKEGVAGTSLDVVAKGLDIFPPKNGNGQRNSNGGGSNQQQNNSQQSGWGNQQQDAGGWGNGGADDAPPF
ncbi:single-stranded DNA-binding protein [Arthrobacter sp. UYCu723]